MTIGYTLLLAGLAVLGLAVLGFFIFCMRWLVEAIRNKEYDEIMIPLAGIGILLFMTGIACTAIGEAEQKRQSKEPVVINAVQQDNK